ncbi:DUF4031 domain-containing protein [Mycolicibacterium fortuitum]|uniref:DUF4031 domain-containing protein n=1 Tax=Mycolicibacterium fortuitum subsp. acetamidolyticum TaxID=144550 RepID=A0A100WN78_MYCFO|nr:DUF4031 domain-containing protein [Mycolicibacterium fortuitum]GAT01321.1 putative uncharacterized protein [Mycolicibacterium fortuitum subsp. acetamidolyticum]
MTVYVDDVRIRATVGRHDAVWSHLFADTQDELHAFAARLGLRRSWFQDPVKSGKPFKARPGSRASHNWHYDVTEGKRCQAVALGAVEVSWREAVAIIDARYHRAQTDADAAAEPGVNGGEDVTTFEAWREGRVSPRAITAALDIRQLYGPEVDRACGVEEPAVDQWEAGQLYPSWEQLQALARLTGFPVRFFTRGYVGEVSSGFVCRRSGRGRGCEQIEGPKGPREFPQEVVAATDGTSRHPLTLW